MLECFVHLQEHDKNGWATERGGVVHLKKDKKQETNKTTSRALARSFAPASEMLFQERFRLVTVLFTYTQAEQN